MRAYLSYLLSATLLFAHHSQAATPAQQQAAADDAWRRASEPLARTEQALQELNQALSHLLATPDTDTLATARQTWQTAHRQWLLLSPLLQLGEVDAKRFHALRQWRFQIQARELQPGYLDALPDYPLSGLVNDLAIPLTKASLREQHGLTDDSEVSLGFHALALLLWDFDGNRQLDELRAQQTLNTEQRRAGYTLDELPNNRRRMLLSLLGQILLEDVQQLHAHWQNTESHLGRSYWQLSGAQRLPLLRQAAHSLLLDLDNLGQPVFSREDDRATLLEGLQAFLGQGEPSLISVMLEEPAAQAWLANLATIRDALNQPEGIDEAVLRDHRETLAQALTPAP